jgi:hypothetical protein
MSESDKETVTVVTPKNPPIPSLADSVASSLESLAKKVRKGQVFGFTLVWMGGSTIQVITSPENPAPDSASAAEIPLPDPNDPKERRRAEVAAYFDGMFKALAENKQWSPKIGERIKTEMSELWTGIHQCGQDADAATLRYIEGEITDPEVYQKAVNNMGSAWRDAFAKLEALDQSRNGAGPQSGVGGSEHPF